MPRRISPLLVAGLLIACGGTHLVAGGSPESRVVSPGIAHAADLHVLDRTSGSLFRVDSLPSLPTLRRRLAGLSRNPWALAVSPDGRYFAESHWIETPPLIIEVNVYEMGDVEESASEQHPILTRTVSHKFNDLFFVSRSELALLFSDHMEIVRVDDLTAVQESFSYPDGFQHHATYKPPVYPRRDAPLVIAGTDNAGYAVSFRNGGPQYSYLGRIAGSRSVPLWVDDEMVLLTDEFCFELRLAEIDGNSVNAKEIPAEIIFASTESSELMFRRDHVLAAFPYPAGDDKPYAVLVVMASGQVLRLTRDAVEEITLDGFSGTEGRYSDAAFLQTEAGLFLVAANGASGLEGVEVVLVAH